MQYIGYYDDEAEAARAYDRAILKFRGPGHRINFPDEQYTPEEIAAAPKIEPQVLFNKGSPKQLRRRALPLSALPSSSLCRLFLAKLCEFHLVSVCRANQQAWLSAGR